MPLVITDTLVEEKILVRGTWHCVIGQQRRSRCKHVCSPRRSQRPLLQTVRNTARTGGGVVTASCKCKNTSPPPLDVYYYFFCTLFFSGTAPASFPAISNAGLFFVFSIQKAHFYELLAITSTLTYSLRVRGTAVLYLHHQRIGFSFSVHGGR